jgi:Tfp pilus assembly protein FimT
MHKNLPALTLIELMLVIGILAVVAVPSFIAVNTFRQKQALTSAAESLQGVVTRARIYARESKGGKTWGVKYIDDSSYKLVTMASGVEETQAEYQLDSAVKFTSGSFAVWFGQVTGEASVATNIDLATRSGGGARISVSKSGLVGLVKI